MVNDRLDKVDASFCHCERAFFSECGNLRLNNDVFARLGRRSPRRGEHASRDDREWMSGFVQLLPDQYRFYRFEVHFKFLKICVICVICGPISLLCEAVQISNL